jgi:hypothetical protein
MGYIIDVIFGGKKQLLLFKSLSEVGWPGALSKIKRILNAKLFFLQYFWTEMQSESFFKQRLSDNPSLFI